ncbi:MAG: hypothetical protein DMG57_14250 [Acidobacteria bacterium]|nr:MAG: hypothetical protein DMG57_14250 [Acidobacteriota bacterium]
MKKSALRYVGLPLLTCALGMARTIPDRYIVELVAAPAAARVTARGRQAQRLELAGRRSEVRAEQLRTRAAIEQEGGEVLATLDTVGNAMIVRMPALEASKLFGVQGVSRVHPEREFKLLLDRAVVVHKIVDAWNDIGLDRAGRGIKIGMIDTGIDITHPAFQDSSLPIPTGFPKVGQDTDTAYTNNKVIVARSYVNLLSGSDPDKSAKDDQGHGTATAMAAAGVQNSGPLATIRGVAPKAYLGSYKVFGSPGVNDTATEGAILKAIDDAVADGMDVINMSLGDALAESLAQDFEVQALQNAAALGVIVVVSAGNTGPDLHTIGSPASAPAAITVGASFNDREFGGSVNADGKSYFAIPGSSQAPPHPISASLTDTAALESDGLACSAFPSGSLQGKIALILRGTCFFVDKLNNVQAAGAVAALIYTDAARPDPIPMDVQSATLPAIMVSYPDGVDIKHRLVANAQMNTTLDFTIAARSVSSDRLADFTAKGPNVGDSIKPDLVAVGTYVYTAAQKTNSKGDLYRADGYAVVDGTSFSSPIVAGAAALLKSARPGLKVAEYRSLIINSAKSISLKSGLAARVQEAGAGSLNMLAALHATSAEAPTSISFGIATADVHESSTLTITNVGSTAETFTLWSTTRGAPLGFVAPDSRTAETIEISGKTPAVTLSTNLITLNPGASTGVTVALTGFGLPPGSYDSFIHILGAKSGVESRVPVWYGVASGVPANITILNVKDKPSPGSLNPDAAFFRVTDAGGITVPDASPKATVVSGGGSVHDITVMDGTFPGVFGLSVTLGRTAGSNVFRIQAGDVTKEVTIVSVSQ